MSKKKKRRRQRQVYNINNKKQEPSVRRYIVPLTEWKRFERFKELVPHIEEALADLQENWASHADWLKEEQAIVEGDLEDMHDTFVRLSDLIRNLDLSHKKAKRNTYYEHKQYDSPTNYESVGMRPRKRYDNMMAEIMIEDISDGCL